MRLSILIFASFFLSAPLSAQEIIYHFGQWKHTSLNGSISMHSLYRNQENILRSGRMEKPVTKYFNGEFKLRSKSYIWHPNFMKISIDLGYNPGVRNEAFLVIPNRSETRTAEQIRLQTMFFEQRPLSLNFFTNLSHSFINREYTSSVESYRKDFGAGLSFRNKFAPLSVNYLNTDWEQIEFSTGRPYNTERENLHIEVNNSLTEGNKNQFSYNYDDARRVYGFAEDVQNYTHALRLSNRFSFDKLRRSNWNSLITFRHQRGSQPFERWQIVQQGKIRLPQNFSTGIHYRFADYQQYQIENRQHNISGHIEHQLYLSLKSRVFYEYIDISQPSFSDYINRAGLSFRYQKKIPTGLIKLGYNYIRRSDRRHAGDGSRFIIGENQILSDDRTIILENPYADPLSILVWDEAHIVLYEENIDYLLLPRGDYLEIQRLPGGKITNGQTVSIDYKIVQVNAFDYNTNLNLYKAGINLFGRLLEAYFRLQDQDYDHVNISAARFLKTVYQQVYGVRLNWRYFTAGWEYDDYRSNIVPYHSTRYYLNFSHTMFRSLDIYLTGNWRERNLTADAEIQSFADFSGRIGYRITRTTKLSLNGGYRFQDGRGIDLDLTNMRMELTHRIRKLYLSGGIELYRRDFSGEIINYQGGFLRVERKF